MMEIRIETHVEDGRPTSAALTCGRCGAMLAEGALRPFRRDESPSYSTVVTIPADHACRSNDLPPSSATAGRPDRGRPAAGPVGR